MVFEQIKAARVFYRLDRWEVVGALMYRIQDHEIETVWMGMFRPNA